MRWLSQYRLLPQETYALRITDRYSLHRVVYDLFEDTRQGKYKGSSGILFADKGMRKGVRTLVILSDRLPRTPRCGDLQSRKLTDAYLQAREYFFEIVVNPVRRINCSGKIEPLCTYDSIAEWFLAKASAWGFSVYEPSLQVVARDVQRFNKGETAVTIATATLRGSLHVTDQHSFERSVYQGIGRAKAFGCGLLQIIPYNV